MYRTGRGVPVDQMQAYIWLTLARAAGDVDGKHSAPEAAALLKPGEIQVANDMIVEFMKKQKARDAALAERR